MIVSEANPGKERMLDQSNNERAIVIIYGITITATTSPPHPSGKPVKTISTYVLGAASLVVSPSFLECKQPIFYRETFSREK